MNPAGCAASCHRAAPTTPANELPAKAAPGPAIANAIPARDHPRSARLFQRSASRSCLSCWSSWWVQRRDLAAGSPAFHLGCGKLPGGNLAPSIAVTSRRRARPARLTPPPPFPRQSLLSFKVAVPAKSPFAPPTETSAAQQGCAHQVAPHFSPKQAPPSHSMPIFPVSLFGRTVPMPVVRP